MPDQPNRAVANLLDFLTAAVIVVGAISVYFGASAVLLNLQTDNGGGAAHAGLRAQERLVDDVFHNGTGDGTIDAGCVRAFFATSGNRSCGFADRGSGQPYLRTVLGIGPTYALNVTVEDTDGVVTLDPSGGSRAYRHAIGPSAPTDGEVTVYYRTVTFGTDLTGDGRIDYFRAYLRLWEAR